MNSCDGQHNRIEKSNNDNNKSGINKGYALKKFFKVAKEFFFYILRLEMYAVGKKK